MFVPACRERFLLASNSTDSPRMVSPIASISPESAVVGFVTNLIPLSDSICPPAYLLLSNLDSLLLLLEPTLT